MAHWGIAWAHTADYNFSAPKGFYTVAAQPDGFPSFRVAKSAIQRAVELLDSSSSAKERGLIMAMDTLIEWPVTPSAASRLELFAATMELLASSAAGLRDADVQALCAEAVLNLSPWDLWEADHRTPKPVGVRAKAILDRGLALAPHHPLLCHLKVHHDEMGPPALFDWAAAEALRATDATAVGHLVHMPTHLDIQVGQYEKAMVGNELAAAADLRQHALAPARFHIYFGYVVHNMEFTAWAAMYAGCCARALAASDAIDGFLTEAVLSAVPPLQTYFEAYVTTRLMVHVRFGLWEAILAMPFASDAAVYQAHTLYLHWARGLALGVKGDVKGAREEQTRFGALLGALRPGDRLKHNINLAEHMGPISEAILEGELCYREGRLDAAYEVLARAVELYDALPYDEPSGYLMSPRQTYGALLVEQGRFEAAAPLYEADLRLFPHNIWALAGLRLCLLEGAPTNIMSLAEVLAALKAAQTLADTPVGASCACARKFAAGE